VRDRSGGPSTVGTVSAQVIGSGLDLARASQANNAGKGDRA
jgi:hypothetical protein